MPLLPSSSSWTLSRSATPFTTAIAFRSKLHRVRAIAAGGAGFWPAVRQKKYAREPSERSRKKQGLTQVLRAASSKPKEGSDGAGKSATKAMSVSLSGKQGRYVRQLTGWHNDIDLHVALWAGDAAALHRELDEATVVVATGEGLEAVGHTVAMEANEAGETRSWPPWRRATSRWWWSCSGTSTPRASS
ncbi:hypothetical protein ZWY2020_014930 [Hordeum vulgare]|nr:hypothetical protein ZWY2020_014930 [Hordeum vulgare]